jgi:hypothetical protein
MPSEDPRHHPGRGYFLDPSGNVPAYSTVAGILAADIRDWAT